MFDCEREDGRERSSLIGELVNWFVFDVGTLRRRFGMPGHDAGGLTRFMDAAQCNANYHFGCACVWVIVSWSE